jgi:cytochrome c oxidase subunit 1
VHLGHKALNIVVSILLAIVGGILMTRTLQHVVFDGQSAWFLSLFWLGFSSLMGAVNYLTTIIKLRAPGMTMFRMPLSVWSLFITSILVLLATPVLASTLMMNLLDHHRLTQFFLPFNWTLSGVPQDVAGGGYAILHQHLFWFYSHPAVYIMILPAMAVISEVVCAFSRNRPASYRAIAYSSLGIAFVGFLTWGHHMFVAGMSLLDSGAFGILSMFTAIFSAIKVFTWTATLRRGSITFETPMLYFFWFLFLFVFGGMTGVATATSSLDVHWHDTYFIVAHFHFIMVGGTLTAYLAALHYWFPKMFGRRYPERWAMVASISVFTGFFFTFMPQFLLGNAGMPRRYWSYPPKYQWLHVLSTAGASVLALGMLLTLAYLLVALVNGPKAERNPWGARSFEWLAESPPLPHNFDEQPPMTRGPYDFDLPE